MQKEYIVYVKQTISNKMSVAVASNMKSVIMNQKRNPGPGTACGSKIVYFEAKQNKRQALAREKELKGLNRKALVSVIRASNPEMLDLRSTWDEENALFTQNSFYL